MDEREYQRRKQELERQLEAGIELLRAGNRSQRTALDLVWAASPQNQRSGLLPFEIALAPGGPATAPRPAAPLPPAPARKRRWKAGELREMVESALRQVAEEFSRDDLLRVMSAHPDRGSLHRVLQELRSEGTIERLQSGRGQEPSRYRQLASRRAEGTSPQA